MNPFIRLLQDPVTTLTIAGYLITMTAITLLGLSYTLREASKLAVLSTREHRRGSGPYEEWWGEYADGWIPPASWTIRAAKVVFVSVLLVWALATIAYMVT